MDTAFDRLVARLDHAVVVVTAAGGGERSGCLVGFHGPVSIEPRRYAVWISKLNHTHGVLGDADHFAVHVLEAGDRDLAERFGGETADAGVDKFAGLETADGPGGAPVLLRCPSRAVFRRTSSFDAGGDHECFVGAPVEVEVAGDGPSMRFAAVRDIDAGHPVD